MGDGLFKLHCDTSIVLTWGTYIRLLIVSLALFYTTGYYFYTLDNVLVLICKWFLSAFTSKEFLALIWYYSLSFCHIEVVLSVQDLWDPRVAARRGMIGLGRLPGGPSTAVLQLPLTKYWNDGVCKNSGVGLLPFSHHYTYSLRNHFHHVLQSPSDLA